MVKDIIIESEAIKKLSMIMEKEGFKNITIICDENTYAAAGEEIKEIICSDVITYHGISNGHHKFC